MRPLVECVPNFSFGKDPELLGELGSAVEAGGGLVLDASSDPDHERSVVTWVAEPALVGSIGERQIELARDRIDLRSHSGVHPRIGACDVFPLIPVGGADDALCVSLARDLGARAAALEVPVYYYGKAARRPEREALPGVRRGGFEGLVRALAKEPPDPLRIPDEGGARLHPSAGAVAIGVRPFLVAFNIQLESDDLEAARDIARLVRESSGGLPGIRALGLRLESRGITQVSCNVCDPGQTGLVTLFERVEELARQRGIGVRESELIGLAPRAALDREIAERVQLEGFCPERHVLEDNLARRLP